MENTEANQGYGKRPMWQWIAIYAVIAIIVYGLFYYFVIAKKGGYSVNQSGQYAQTRAASPTTASPPSVVSPTTTTATTTAMQITVTGSEFAFNPSTITVKAGQPVQLTFKNMGQYPHNFSITDLDIQTKTIQSGQEDTITFTPSKTGSFAYICTVPDHADRGMKGTLIVQ